MSSYGNAGYNDSQNLPYNYGSAGYTAPNRTPQAPPPMSHGSENVLIPNESVKEIPIGSGGYIDPQYKNAGSDGYHQHNVGIGSGVGIGKSVEPNFGKNQNSVAPGSAGYDPYGEGAPTSGIGSGISDDLTFRNFQQTIFVQP